MFNSFIQSQVWVFTVNYENRKKVNSGKLSSSGLSKRFLATLVFFERLNYAFKLNFAWICSVVLLVVQLDNNTRFTSYLTKHCSPKAKVHIYSLGIKKRSLGNVVHLGTGCNETLAKSAKQIYA